MRYVRSLFLAEPGSVRRNLKSDLDVLTAVEQGETVSQLVLSRRVGVAVGLVNALLRRALSKGYVKVQNVPARRYAYYLTPKGFAEKGRLVSEYIEVSLDFFRQAREQYATLFGRAQALGHKRIALVGQGELVEIAAITAMDAGIEILGVVSKKTNKAKLSGLQVFSDLNELGALDAVVLADSFSAQETYDGLIDALGKDRVMAPPLLRLRHRDGSKVVT